MTTWYIFQECKTGRTLKKLSPVSENIRKITTNVLYQSEEKSSRQNPKVFGNKAKKSIAFLS